MKLRNKTLLTVGLPIVVLIAVCIMFARHVMLDGFLKVEDKFVRADMQRALNALRIEEANLGVTALDWSAWDDTYRFMEDGNAEYIKLNLPDSTFDYLMLDILAFVRPSGRIVYGKGYDLDEGGKTTLPSGLGDHLKPGSPLVSHKDTGSSVSGLLRLPGGVYLVASRPVLTSEFKGPIRGALIMGRLLDEKEIGRISDTTGLALSLLDFDAARSVAGIVAGTGTEPNGEDGFSVRQGSEDTISAYAVLKDIYGKPSLLLRADMPRDILTQGRAAISYFSIAFLVAGFVFAAAIWLIMDRSVVSRLGVLSSRLGGILKTGDLSSRVSIEGNDELGGISRDINCLLGFLERHSRENYFGLFEDSPVSLWIEDFSEIKKSLDGLEKEGVEDVRGYLEGRPEEVRRCLSMLRIIDVNKATVKLYGAKSKQELLDNIERTFSAESFDSFKEGLVALAEGKVFFEFGARAKTLSGDDMDVNVKWSVLPGHEGSFTKVLLSIIDVTGQKTFEEALRSTSEYLKALIHASPVTIMALDRDGNVTLWNPAAQRTFGWTESETIGRPNPMVPEQKMAEFLALKDRVLRGEWLQGVEVQRIKKDGSAIDVGISAAPLIGPGNETIGIIAVCEDITERKLSDMKLRKSLREKEVLLREIHHRVKNNMQVVSSLLKLQSKRITDPDTLELFEESQNRIRTMALIHESLYMSDDFSSIDFRAYVVELVRNLTRSFDAMARKISVKIDVEQLSINPDTAIPCGLIINELVSNSFKHAFPEGRKGSVGISMKRKGDELELSVSDDGIGMPEGFDMNSVGSLGLELVGLLSEHQLRGQLRVDVDGGTKFTVTFKGPLG